MGKTAFVSLLVSLIFCAFLGLAVSEHDKRSIPVSHDTPTGQPQVATDQDGGVYAFNTTELCGIKMTWNYLDQNVEIENGNGQAAEVLFVPGSRVAMSPYQVMTVDHSGMIVVRGCRKNVTVKLDAANGLPDRQCSKTYVLGQ